MKLPAGWKLTPDGKRAAIALDTEDFLSAMDLFEEIAEVAEELEHHPDLHLEGYHHVRIETYSHDVGKLTERDEQLAARISEVLDERGLKPR